MKPTSERIFSWAYHTRAFQPWIPLLDNFVRTAYAKRIPRVGVCFGHQLIAQTRGGTVCRSKKGWGIGRHVYEIVPGEGVMEGERIALACSHQDQVI